MDQNTNNSFTSAPQGGDFSDIIIPNAYATKPKGKNLKKYVIFGAIGAVALILISLIVKAIFVDSRTMSKQEFIQLAQSDDMMSVDGIENFFYAIYKNDIEVEELFSDEKYNLIRKYEKSLKIIKDKLDKKQEISGDNRSRNKYKGFRDEFRSRYTIYVQAINLYGDFYYSYKNLDIESISKYKNNAEYSGFIEKFEELIEQKKKIKNLLEEQKCIYKNDKIGISDYCVNQGRVESSISDGIYNSADIKKVFYFIFDIDNYDERDNLTVYADNLSNELR